ncbi:hypothetical protein [Oricola sp.]|uniref:hypothetical protein n=1 Tax=Oricola sp. TaxID=1979950 RepID=UPI003BA8D06F
METEFDRDIEDGFEEASLDPDAKDPDGFEWAIIEIFGHRTHAGRAREEERFGSKMLRIDVPTLSHVSTDAETGESSYGISRWTTRYYGGGAVFSYVVTDEQAVMRANRPYISPYRARLLDHQEQDPDIDLVEE